MKSRFAKPQSLKRALKRKTKILVADKTAEGGVSIRKVPSRNKDQFIQKNKKQLLEFIDQEKAREEAKKAERKAMMESLNHKDGPQATEE